MQIQKKWSETDFGEMQMFVSLWAVGSTLMIISIKQLWTLLECMDYAEYGWQWCYLEF